MQLSFLKRFEAKIQKTDSCWLWTGTSFKSGYGKIRINTKEYRAHRISYELFVGPIPEGLYVCHTCDKPICVNPSHLFVGTHRDNTDDMVKKGRHRSNPPRNEQHWNSKLSTEDIKTIRTELEQGCSGAELAKKFMVTKQTISKIKTRRSHEIT